MVPTPRDYFSAYYGTPLACREHVEIGQKRYEDGFLTKLEYIAFWKEQQPLRKRLWAMATRQNLGGCQKVGTALLSCYVYEYWRQDECKSGASSSCDAGRIVPTTSLFRCSWVITLFSWTRPNSILQQVLPDAFASCTREAEMLAQSYEEFDDDLGDDGHDGDTADEDVLQFWDSDEECLDEVLT